MQLLADVRHHRSHGIIAFKRWLAAEEEIADSPQCVDVRTGVDVLTRCDLLRCHVQRCANDTTLVGTVTGSRDLALDESEVEQC